ncbi:energy transducer TonB [Pedobacter sp.]|uniref:energy transducer TonB n=1 Tax=Pedobacter sp. TaxID=1411316 RepID=UPI003D7F6F57
MRQFLTLLFLLSTTLVVAQPKIKGGLDNFIKTNLHYPSYSMRNCLEGSITIAFKLSKQGRVYQSRVQSGIGTDLDEEALRLIRKSSGQWMMPAGYDTTTVLVVPVNFKLQGYDCNQKSKVEKQQAVAAYQAGEGLTDAILNFYRNKEAGTYKKEDESRFLKLKEELGYNKAYMEGKIEDALRKIKQKDQEGACEDLLFVKHMGFDLADELLKKYCP